MPQVQIYLDEEENRAVETIQQFENIGSKMDTIKKIIRAYADELPLEELREKIEARGE